MNKYLLNFLVSLFLFGAFLWMLLVVSTTFFTQNNPFLPVISSVLNVDNSFQAKPKIVKEVETFDDFLYSDIIYGFLGASSLVAATSLFVLTRGRNLIEKFILLQAYALPRERNYWGSVIDKKNRAPIPFATVRLYKLEAGMQNYLTQKVTDLDGRYRLYLSEDQGDYLLEVQSTGYSTYHHQIEPSFIESGNAVRVTVLLEKVTEIEKVNMITKLWAENKAKVIVALTAYIYVLSLFTCLHAVYSIIMHFGFVSVGDLVFYGFAGPWNTFVLWERQRFNPGKVINAQTNLPLSGVTVQVVLASGAVLSAVSDLQGVTKFDAEAGDYKVKLFKPGFTLEGSLANATQMGINKEGYLSRNVYFMPLPGAATGPEGLPTPFGN